MKKMGKKVRFHITLISLVLIIVITMTSATVMLVLKVSRRTSTQTAEQLFADVGASVCEHVAGKIQPALDLVSILAFAPSVGEPVSGDGLDHAGGPLLIQALRTIPGVYSVYIGYETGDFLQVIHAANDARILDAHDAPAGTAFIYRSITADGDTRIQRWTFLNDAHRVITSRIEPEAGQVVEYDPRVRPWYLGTDGSDAAVLSQPYLFHSLGQMGVTASHRLGPFGGDSAGVVGVDITLADLERFISTQRVSPNGTVSLLDSTGTVIAGSPVTISSTGNAGWLQHTEQQTFAGDWPVTVLVRAPLSDFMHDFESLRRSILLVALLLLLAGVPVVLVFGHKLSSELKLLANDAKRVQKLDFSGPLPVTSPIQEFYELAHGFTMMKGTLSESLEKLEKIIELGIAISAEKDINRLTEMILLGAKELSHADGGSLYLLNRERRILDFQIILNDSLGIVQGGTSGIPITLSSVPLYDAKGNENHHNVVTHAFHTEETVNIPDAYDTHDFDFSGTRVFDEKNQYRSTSFLTVPLKPRGGGVIGALQLINAGTGSREEGERGRIVEFSPENQRFVEALTAVAAVALQNRDLLEAQKRLFDALVRFIAGAIDAKSPYTGGHCARVPEVARILATAVESVDEGPLAGFRFENDEQRREFLIGAWLHDCGKVTTPEFVVDKATKLETIYNRIHEVRTRFEVVLRDVRIQQYEALLADEGVSGERIAACNRLIAEVEAQLREEFAFVAECNLGGEFMAPEKIDRLNGIAARTWERHFDNRIGLSWEEAQLYLPAENEPGAPLRTVTEHLLADRPEHIVPRQSSFYEMYQGFDFSTPVPDHLYNRGELYNLSVRRGTLTPEERFKINEHVMQTIVMLEQLPLPESLSRVPEYAGTHHETLDGSGYPRGLTADALSIPARIMAIADIFEALTASDRPYKKAKTLSESIGILFLFKKNGHIDADLFDLFLTTGAYREYGERFLLPEQVDEVDISRYVGK